MIFAGIDKYINQPTSTSLDTRDYPVWNIDFPGVTICPNSKVGMSLLRMKLLTPNNVIRIPMNKIFR